MHSWVGILLDVRPKVVGRILFRLISGSVFVRHISIHDQSVDTSKVPARSANELSAAEDTQRNNRKEIE
jgi:hypothetical protein